MKGGIAPLVPMLAPMVLDSVLGSNKNDPSAIHKAQTKINDLQFKAQTHIDKLSNELNECKSQLIYTDNKYHEIKNNLIKKELDCAILSDERTNKENVKYKEMIRLEEIDIAIKNRKEQIDKMNEKQLKLHNEKKELDKEEDSENKQNKQKKMIKLEEIDIANKKKKEKQKKLQEGGNKSKSKNNTIYKIKKGSKKTSCIVGSRAKVFHGICDKTSGGLTKKDLKFNKIGKIVSKKASSSAKKAKNLKKFIAPSNTYSFSKSPKKGSLAYKKIIELSNKTINKTINKTNKSRNLKSKSRNLKNKSRNPKK